MRFLSMYVILGNLFNINAFIFIKSSFYYFTSINISICLELKFMFFFLKKIISYSNHFIIYY